MYIYACVCVYSCDKYVKPDKKTGLKCCTYSYPKNWQSARLGDFQHSGMEASGCWTTVMRRQGGRSNPQRQGSLLPLGRYQTPFVYTAIEMVGSQVSNCYGQEFSRILLHIA